MSARSDYEVRELDRTLADDGEWIEIWRQTGTQLIPVKVDCRASVRGYDEKELIGGITQDQSRIVMSPTEIIKSGWPGPETRPLGQPATMQDRRVPHKNDKAVIKGKVRNIEASMPIYVDNELVRINLRILG